ncbi:LPS export ABC transporter periplasmic protein LptC [Alcaligenaceae bacterium LF4-65]|jgi:lipopolysaccharide export system protein LptC|uniref:LPS export ABC transporter periplasmic protein LptC n=1 Tax=Zwartia hollandica TaxID=324606 RepID=A0A953T3U9_9BURK|nr:LPS export ABC transporter periplasmic protein LptC [Zwartia hollandica]MBZ1349791.1 LPS export ABC transporter periplasmic protein LptC [Zwartia hollandica]
MKERASIIVSLFILVTLVLGTWWAADYSQRAVEIDPPSRITHEPDTWAKKIVLLRTDEKGFVIHRLEGDLMEHFPDDKSYELISPRAFALKPENPLTVATSRMAVIYDEGNRIIMRGDAVILRLGDAERQPLNFRSDELTLLVKEDLSYTDLPAIATSGRSRMSGVGMRFNNATQQLDVFKSTDVDIAPKDQAAESPSKALMPKP